MKYFQFNFLHSMWVTELTDSTDELLRISMTHPGFVLKTVPEDTIPVWVFNFAWNTGFFDIKTFYFSSGSMHFSQPPSSAKERKQERPSSPTLAYLMPASPLVEKEPSEENQSSMQGIYFNLFYSKM